MEDNNNDGNVENGPVSRGFSVAMDQTPKEELLIRQVDDLREWPEDSEAALDAIRQGDVGAVVVHQPSELANTPLELANDSYRVLVEAMSEGALVISAGGVIAYCNARFAAMLKTTARDLTGSSLFNYVRSEDLSAFEELLQAGFSGGAKGEITLRAEGGSLLPMRFSISPLLMGDFRGACAVVTDLTEQKLIEEEIGKHRLDLERLVDERTEELRRANAELEHRVRGRTGELLRANARMSEEILERQQIQAALQTERDNFKNLTQEFNTLLNAISDTLVLFSSDMEISWTNCGNVQQLDGAVSEVAGHDCRELLRDLSTASEDSPVVKCFDTGEREGSVLTHNGAVLDLRAFPITEGGRVSRVLLLASDITAKMALQAEAMQACHLASLGELAAGIAHEINNPVTGVINYGQILINECSAESMEHDIGKRIVKEGERIGRTVRTLLSYARDDERECKKVASFPEILGESIILTQAQIRKEGIELKIDLPDDLPEVEVNFQQIQQGFINIISNARYALNEKYPGRHEHKLLEITGEKVTVNARPHVRIVFHDHGVGVSPHELPMLTKAFFSTKPFGKGTGLGLNITDRIVKDHGGFLSFESREGEFTKVIIDLPAKVKNECQDSSH